MGRIYRFHNLTVGKILSSERDAREKQRAQHKEADEGGAELGFHGDERSVLGRSASSSSEDFRSVGTEMPSLSSYM